MASASTKTAWSSDLLMDHPSLPAGLLNDTTLPFERQGLGDFVGYGQRVQVVCDQKVRPVRKTSGAAGYDLYSVEGKTIPAGGSTIFDTGVAIALPTHHYGKIESLSSLGVAHDVVAFGRIIDEDYRGRINVKLFNHGLCDYIVQTHDCIAQLVVQKYSVPSFRVVGEFSSGGWGNCDKRGSVGFGSTGK